MADKSTTEKSDAKRIDQVKDISRDVWLAGLGVMQEIGGRGSERFKALVEEGKKLETKLKQQNDKGTTKAKEIVNYDKFKEQFEDVRVRADKLQNVFEERVSEVLARIGIPSRKEVNELKAEIARLQDEKGTAKSGKTGGNAV